jgi:hypothetical protein
VKRRLGPVFFFLYVILLLYFNINLVKWERCGQGRNGMPRREWGREEWKGGNISFILYFCIFIVYMLVYVKNFIEILYFCSIVHILSATT